jgi:hypothetical protein
VGQSAYRIAAILQISIILLIYMGKSGFSKIKLLKLLKFLSGTFCTFCTPQPGITPNESVLAKVFLDQRNGL